MREKLLSGSFARPLVDLAFRRSASRQACGYDGFLPQGP